MNERIEKIAKEHGFIHEFMSPGEKNDALKKYEKFAELIVRECIDCLDPLSKNHSMVGAAQDTIKNHFGVKE